MEHPEDFPSLPAEMEDELSELGDTPLGLGFKMGKQSEMLGGGDEEDWEEEEEESNDLEGDGLGEEEESEW